MSFHREDKHTMQVRVYATLRDLVSAKAIELDVRESTDVRRLLRQASSTYPALGAKLWDEQDDLNKSIQVLVNGRAIAFLDGLDTLVSPEDRVDLFPPVGGG
jgi:molybdopterin synthase sulfur carrier subunit